MSTADRYREAGMRPPAGEPTPAPQDQHVEADGPDNDQPA